jgi:DNA-directed RNA polymerase specialized sigma54-like protein
MKTYDYNEKEYELRYAAKRIELIEEMTGKSVIGNLMATKGALGLSDLKQYFVIGLKETDGRYVSNKTGQEMASKLIEEEGYTKVLSDVLERIQEDCPFMFREN